MKIKLTKKNVILLFLLIDVSIITIPIILNFIINAPSPIPQEYIIGNANDWLSFWGVYIGSMGTFIMAAVALVTIFQNGRMAKQNDTLLAQNKEQLEELKRQWEEDRRPRLNVSIIIFHKAFYIKIKNIGKQNATNIKFQFNDDFVKMLPKDVYREMYANVTRLPFVIEAGECKYLAIGFCELISKEWKDRNVIIQIDGHYCDKYELHETFYMDEFITQRFMAVTDELTASMSAIEHGLVSSTNGQYSIQKSLDTISKVYEKGCENTQCC